VFATGAIYKGEWKDDKLSGNGTLYSPNGEIIETKFENGKVLSGKVGGSNKVKYLMADGSYYEGTYADDMRQGKGRQIYPTQDIYEGDWQNDMREGKGKLSF
jgi:hypothetical protein